MRHKWAAVALVLGWFWAMTAPVLAAPKYDFIIVGNRKSPVQGKLLHAARARLEKMRADLGLTSEDLPVDEYDISDAGHVAALKKIGIPTSWAPFVGLCRLNPSGDRPVKMLYGVGPIHDLDKAMAMVLSHASQDLGIALPSAQNSPVSVVRNFFVALVNHRDNEAWRLLSAGSQNEIIKQIAQSGNVDEATVRHYFDKGEPEILKKFFDPLREGLSASKVNGSDYSVVNEGDVQAKVHSNVIGDHNWWLLKENTEWKFGMMETLFPDKFPALANQSDTTAEPTPTPVPPDVTENDDAAPANAAHRFFSLISQTDYKGAWDALTPRTQTAFVDAVAEKANMSHAKIQAAFDDGSLRKEFFDSFRKSSHSDEYASGGTFRTESIDGDVATVHIALPGGDSGRELKMYHQKGQWKVGWMETFFPNGLNSDSQ